MSTRRPGRSPSTGSSILIVVFVGTIAVGATSGAAAVAALPGIFVSVAWLIKLLRTERQTDEDVEPAVDRDTTAESRS